VSASAALAAVAQLMGWSAVLLAHIAVRQIPWCARLDPARRHQADQLGALSVASVDDRTPPFPLGLMPGVIATLGGGWS